MEHGDQTERGQVPRWLVDIRVGFGGMAAGFEEGFKASVAAAAVGPVEVSASPDGMRAAFELEGHDRAEVEASAQTIGRDALRAGAASVRNPRPGPHGWIFSVGIEPAAPI